MNNMMSREAAEENLRMFFKNTSANEVSVEDVYAAADRLQYPEAQNKSWLGNKLWSMGSYNFIKRNYGLRNSKKQLKSLSLTEEGMKVLRRPGTPQELFPPVNNFRTVPSGNSQPVTLQTVTDIADEFHKQNPSWVIRVIPERVKEEAPRLTE